MDPQAYYLLPFTYEELAALIDSEEERIAAVKDWRPGQAHPDGPVAARAFDRVRTQYATAFAEGARESRSLSEVTAVNRARADVDRRLPEYGPDAIGRLGDDDLRVLAGLVAETLVERGLRFPEVELVLPGEVV